MIEVEAMIEHIVEGVAGLSRIEKHLFQTQEGLDVQEISVMQIKEKPVKDTKSKIEKVIRKNTAGPERYIFILLPKLPSWLFQFQTQYWMSRLKYPAFEKNVAS